MQRTFSFYTGLCNEFFTTLGEKVETKTLNSYLQNDLRPKLFDAQYCRTIEETKKKFLAENIKLEQFVQQTDFQYHFLNDLDSLKQVSDAIYELLQTHWELYKYEKSVVNDQVLISFMLEIDRIGIGWDAYLEKYLAISKLLKMIGGEIPKEGSRVMTVRYHLPDNIEFSASMSIALVQFLQTAFEFILNIQGGKKEDQKTLEVLSLETQRPISCMIRVPEELAEGVSKFINYLSVDILKRETLVKFVMEVVRLQQGKELTKAAITSFQKNIAKRLKELHTESYLSIDRENTEDSVTVLSSLCSEMDQLKIKYKDLLFGSTNRLVVNRPTQTPSEPQRQKHSNDTGFVTDSKVSTGIIVPAGPGEKENTAKVGEKQTPTKVPAPKDIKGRPSEEKASDTTAAKAKSTVKINVDKKEHINFLTS